MQGDTGIGRRGHYAGAGGGQAGAGPVRAGHMRGSGAVRYRHGRWLGAGPGRHGHRRADGGDSDGAGEAQTGVGRRRAIFPGYCRAWGERSPVFSAPYSPWCNGRTTARLPSPTFTRSPLYRTHCENSAFVLLARAYGARWDRKEKRVSTTHLRQNRQWRS